VYTILIPIGATESEVSKELETQEIIQSALAYRIQARLSGKQGSMRAGQYEVRSSQSVNELLNLFASGDVSVDLLTILPAQRLAQIERAFLEAGYSEAEVSRALDPKNYVGHPALEDKPANASLEGYLFPESFQITSATDLTEIVESSLDLMATLLTNQRKSALANIGLTPHEGIIIASIIEEEVSILEDKPLVAQVFLKRLNEGISLGSDPTAFYGASLEGLEETVFVDSPYNTRIYTGLPPGPISNISASSLDALLNPSDTEYLYFVSGDDGTTYFSNTLQEHEEKTARYCTVLCQ
jgi:UPF0755 protein